MPAKETRMSRTRIAPPIGTDHWALLNDQPVADKLACFTFKVEREALWQAHGAQVLREWIPTRPGARPSCWWLYDAPVKQRVRLGGKGTPAHECLNVQQNYHRGLPKTWVTDAEVAYYTGTATDIHGALIAPQNVGRTFAAERFDPRDPPRFESEASCLKRIGLLVPGELANIPAAAFKPETLPRELWPFDVVDDEDDDEDDA